MGGSKEEGTVNGRASIEPDGADGVRVAFFKGTLFLAVGEAGGGPDVGELEVVGRDGGGEGGNGDFGINGDEAGVRVQCAMAPVSEGVRGRGGRGRGVGLVHAGKEACREV